MSGLNRISTSGGREARRGVASVLAMMFLVIFGSLAAAMAVVAQANLRTADSSLKMSRAMSAAETGMVFARKRLASEAGRFVVEKGVIDGDFAKDLWIGTVDEGSDGAVTVLDPTGYVENTPPSGIAEAIRNAHLADSHSVIINTSDSSLPEIDSTYGTLRVRPIALANAAGSAYFRLTYELVDELPYVRVTSEGVDGDIHRTLQMDFKIDKKIEFAILSPNRIMIGKNVLIEGPLGSRYGTVSGELSTPNGDPLVMKSDFRYLTAALNTKIDTLTAQVRGYDVDLDNMLRPDHPTEKTGLNGHPELADDDGDEYVSDFDLFLAQYDSNGDKRVVYSTAKAGAAGLGSLSAEFSGVDDQLARLIDMADADRDDDGEITASDTALGYNDGVLDYKDNYAKVRGRLGFAVARAPWDTANGSSYQNIVQGSIRPKIDQAPVTFQVSDNDMREITTDMFNASATWFSNQASAGSPFATQVAASGGTYTAPSNSTWESVPYGASATGVYDYYKRPIYSNMTFTNVTIPKGTNAVFDNCTFVGVTYMQTNVECTDNNWNYAGAVEPGPVVGGVQTYVLKFAPSINQATIPSSGVVVTDTRTESNSTRFNNCTFLGSLTGDKPGEFTHWRNKVQMTGNTRFYVDPDDDDLAAQSDHATLQGLLNGISAADRAEMEKSSILLPGWSVDVGNFNNDQNADPTLTPKVKLQGTIIAGVFDIRGTAEVHGTMLMTFRPTAGAGPLYYGGQTDAFNTTIGYFGPLDGDGEGVDNPPSGYGEIMLKYDPNAKLPDGIPWPIRIDAAPETYSE